ncbi:MAG TPA: carboxypeptidase-like regulatory domain-containing protein [Cyclobacteriaceae bacterium]|jgi:hypothetical protein|nr:carboxypeptidase-like regulatory domain-containing protein [Cyclobacteriaceae bacterium]
MRWIVFIGCLLLSMGIYAQTVDGTVIDAKTQKPLPYVQIGVPGKNVGVISHDDGKFQIDLSKLETKDTLQFSMIGYEIEKVSYRIIAGGNYTVQLHTASRRLREVQIKGKEIVDLVKLGRFENTKTTTGHSGSDEFGYGGEWGLRIFNDGKTYQVYDARLHLRFNTVDSVLFRINIYKVSNDMPGVSLLDKEIFVTSHKRENWIIKNLESYNLVINEDIIATYEVVRIWYSKSSDNELFFTHGGNYERGGTYSRKSSFAPWEVNKRSPITLYITGRIF